MEKLELEFDDALFQRFMRTFDLSNAPDVGPTPQDRFNRIMNLQIASFEIEEFKRHEGERSNERINQFVVNIKKELGV